MSPEYEPWTQLVVDDWKRAGGNPWDVTYLQAYRANVEIFKGYGYTIEPQRVQLNDPDIIRRYAERFAAIGKNEKATKLLEAGILFEADEHPKRGSNHIFRHLRARELTQDYGFTDNDLMVYFGWSPVSFGKNPYMQRYQNLRWQDYFPKLLRRKI